LRLSLVRGALAVLKVRSTLEDPPQAVQPALEQVLAARANEQVIPGGKILQLLTVGEFHRIRGVVLRTRPEAVAICLLFSFANRTYEHPIARMLQQEGILACASADLLPEFPEY
jgi:N-methylhydantoinase A